MNEEVLEFIADDVVDLVKDNDTYFYVICRDIWNNLKEIVKK